MATLIERIRTARQQRVPSRGKIFIVRRPTDLEAMELREAGGIKQGELITRFVCGWEEFTELDLVPGGGPDAVAFDAALFAEYIADHPEHWPAIVDAVMGGYQTHQDARADTVKNSAPGSTS